ncbi:hypothetical protein IFT47_26635 [Pseudomonas sp. CFBP 13711]|uniref:hypothetical protein n=1 Tax=unclassified Pseudomonas TaxID=196821 RepID=UPI0017826012|nr:MULTISPECIES: hypothetical protein [unclassified Pseudomonas]MBD8710214.1 hypothetical protein [Pseudomonas sp. CFBP 13711]MBD8715501.1 hypothetical protein [Pseudomonas sp. CFBP 13715]
MPMIDPDEIKPTIDSVQAAFAAYSDAGQAYARERNHHPHDSGGLQRTYEAISQTGQAYEDAKSALTPIVHHVIGKAERSAASSMQDVDWPMRRHFAAPQARVLGTLVTKGRAHITC